MAPPDKNVKGSRLICLCNGISQATIEQAVKRGCNSLSKIFDATNAGVGACGGSCQPTLKKMLDAYEQTGKFPEFPRPPSRRMRAKKAGAP